MTLIIGSSGDDNISWKKNKMKKNSWKNYILKFILFSKKKKSLIDNFLGGGGGRKIGWKEVGIWRLAILSNAGKKWKYSKRKI